MKLFTQYNRINMVATLVIFLAASIAFYFTLNVVLFNQVDDDLRIEQREITAYVKQFNRLPENIKVKDQMIAYTPIPVPHPKEKMNTVIQSYLLGQDKEEFRQLRFNIAAGGQWYNVSVSKSLEDIDNFIRLVAAITILTILAILVVSFIINKFVLRKLWQPFNESLTMIKRFRISGNETLAFTPTKIDEFSMMNETLEELTHRAQVDYLSLKTFSENASHEIQTPIAIIQSKLDLLIQDEALTEAQSKTVQTVYDAILRLSRLNASLLLLAKIENRQYDEVEMINLKEKIKEKTADFKELWQAKHLRVACTLQDASLPVNHYLIELLLNNLLSNATKYNIPFGTIAIDLSAHRLMVKNTSAEPALKSEKIFQRFFKSSASTESHGLGLSVVKQICDASGLSINYYFEGGSHSFILQW